MDWKGRRGGVGEGPGRALIQAGMTCLVAAGCATDPPPALLTVVDVEALSLQDSQLLPDSTKVAVRSYLGRARDDVWSDGLDPEMEQLLDRRRGVSALLNLAALPDPGRTAHVLVDVPGDRPHEFRVTHLGDAADRETYTGKAVGDSIVLLLIRDSLTTGRITTAAGVFNFRSARYGLIAISPEDRSGALHEFHLIRSAPRQLAADEYCSPLPGRTRHDHKTRC